MRKLAAIFIVLILGAGTSYAGATFDLKGGLIGSGGYGIGGAVSFPFLQKDMSIKLDVSYAKLGGFNGTFYPVELSVFKNTFFLGQPCYIAGGLNYLISNGKTLINTNVDGGVGGQAIIGTESKLNDTLCLLVEGGILAVQAKVPGGTYSFSTMGLFSLGLRMKPTEQKVTISPVVEDKKAGETVQPVTPEVKGVFDYKLYVAPKTVSKGKPIIIMLIPLSGTKIVGATAIFENNKKVGFVKKPEPGVAEAWKAYFEPPNSFKIGTHRIKVYINFLSGDTHLKALDFKMTK